MSSQTTRPPSGALEEKSGWDAARRDGTTLPMRAPCAGSAATAASEAPRSDSTRPCCAEPSPQAPWRSATPATAAATSRARAPMLATRARAAWQPPGGGERLSTPSSQHGPFAARAGEEAPGQSCWGLSRRDSTTKPRGRPVDLSAVFMLVKRRERGTQCGGYLNLATSRSSARSRPRWKAPTGEKCPDPVCPSTPRSYDAT
mmetsp:Transcript_63302/g.142776  ORF Transcript_63302/g.142776 Transcript_63302/m.142776 type:complete len:202 (-) Transcript_63302:66-671(-)